MGDLGPKRDSPGSLRQRVLGRTVVGADGQARLTLHVFCAARGVSQALDACRTCAECLRVEDAEDPTWLECHDRTPHPPVSVDEEAPPSGAAGDAPTAATPVGAVVLPRVVCVAPDVPLAFVIRLVGLDGLAGMPVVDADGTLLGALPAASELVRYGRHEITSAGAFMTQTHDALLEAMPVWAAMRWMAHHHARVVPVVTRAHVIMGLLRDVDALRWLAHR